MLAITNTSSGNAFRTIYSEAWWREITANGGASERIVAVDGTDIAGCMTFYWQTRWGVLTTGTQPPLTHVFDLFIDEKGAQDALQFEKQRSVTAKLISKLPLWRSYRFTLHQRTGSGIIAAFREAGFECAVRPNYEIPVTHNADMPEKGLKDETGEAPPGPAGRIWDGTSEDLRRKVRKAAKRFDVDVRSSPSAFIAFYSDNLKAKGKKSYFGLETAHELLEECRSRNRLSIMTAIDRKSGETHASLASICDDQSYYYFLVSTAVDADQNALRLLIWNQIKKAVGENRSWDFDGVPDNNRNIENKYREFHPIAAHRIIVYRNSPQQKAFNAMKSIAHVSREERLALLSCPCP